MRKLHKIGWLLLLSVGLLLHACKKDDAPENPYDDVDYSSHNDSTALPDSNTITGLHQYIFAPRCANPGCHDGTFEPDFRTVQSSWSTLVYRSVNMETVDGTHFFSTRVIPNDYAASFLYERITTPTSDYMPSNSIRLTSAEIGHIKTWIMNGARDANGNLPVRPDLPPNIIGYIAADLSFNRIDTIRVGGQQQNPFKVGANTSFYLPVLALDTADGTAATSPANFTVHEVRFSTNKDNFSGATVMQCTYQSPLPVPQTWQTVVNTAQWPSGTTVYFRVYMNDGHQLSPSEFPRTSSPDYYKTYYAFQVQ